MTSLPRTPGATVVWLALLSLSAANAVALTIPSQADWTDHGTIFDRGANGSWDYRLDGAFASTIVKKNGTVFLYYQGASGFRSEDGTVTHRSLGVATSSDGFSFTKHPGNPILSWSPTGNPEEGFFSATAFLQDDGEIDLYWGALTSPNSTSLAVSGDGRLATGFDPLALTDLTEVLDHNDASVWGWGDELSPIAAFEHNGTWYVYYVPNGTPQGHTLGLAWGPSRTQLTNSAPVTSGGLTIAVWGSATYVPIDSDTFALFLNNEGTIQVRTGTYAAPTQLSAPIETYQFPEVSEEATVFLDTDANTWFLYYRHPNLQRYGVKTVPNEGSVTLAVSAIGFGGGLITSSPSGIDCGLDCEQSYSPGTGVALSAIPSVGSTFVEWTGDPDCGDGFVSMTQSHACTADFDVCVDEHDLTLSDVVIDGPSLVEACNSVTIGPDAQIAGPNGSLAVRAPTRIVVANGFEVLSGGTFRVDLGPPQGVP